MLGEILVVSVNTLTAEGKYFVQNFENLQCPIQMELSEKKIFFLHFLFHFWSLHEILNILKEKIFVIAIVFRKLQTVNNLVRTLCEKRRFRTKL